MRQQQGFSIIMAIFILVVLSLLGGYMVKLSGTQHATSVLTLQGARAYQAARAGIEWGMYQLIKNDSCVSSSTISPIAGFNGFSVIVSCDNQGVTYNDGDINNDGVIDANDNFYVYLITSKASYGGFTDDNYIYREIKVTTMK